LLLGYIPLEHVTVLITVGKSNTVVSILILYDHSPTCGPESVVFIATGYGLEVSEIETQDGPTFFPPVQTSHRAHTATCIIGTQSFAGGKERLERDADTSPPTSAMDKKE